MPLCRLAGQSRFTLQLALIIAGAVLVIGVLIFNWWQERRIRRRIDAAFRPAPLPTAVRAPPSRLTPTEVLAVTPGTHREGPPLWLRRFSGMSLRLTTAWSPR